MDVMSDVEVVHYVSADREILPVAYVEDSVGWVVVGMLVAVALAVIVAVLAVFYLAGVWAAGRVGLWAEGRAR
jgi:hypothetical protein